MTLPKLTGGAYGIASVLMLLWGRTAIAKANELVEKQDALPAEPGSSSESGKTDRDTGDVFVTEQGIASWYGRDWRGRRTASASRFDDRALTAAHLWLPFATHARVTNLQNGRSVDVVVTDRPLSSGAHYRPLRYSGRASRPQTLWHRGSDGQHPVLTTPELSSG